MEIYEDITYANAKNMIPALQYNWNLVKMCYEVWKDEIVKARKQKISLREITGVGINYIGRLCNGKIGKTKKNFNAVSEKGLYDKLRGNGYLIDVPLLKKYILVKNYNNKEMFRCDGETWVYNNIKGSKGKDIKELIKEYKKEVKDYIKNAKMIEQDQSGVVKKTDLCFVKEYLMGSNGKKYTLGEVENNKVILLQLVLDVSCGMISKMDDKTLDDFIGYSSILNERLVTEKRVRCVREIEKELLKKVEKN